MARHGGRANDSLTLANKYRTLYIMEKNKPNTILLLLYEVLRLIVILTSRPEFSIDILPASWYASVPLLALPVVLAFLMGNVTKKDFLHEYCRLYILGKILSAPGLLLFCLKAVPVSLSFGQLNGYYSIKRAFLLMIFFVIDVILCAVIFVWLHRKKDKAIELPDSETPDDGENEQCR